MNSLEKSLSPAAWKVTKREILTNLITNTLLNALCAWLINRNALMVPTDFWNVLLDISITSFFTCCLTTFFCTAAAKRYRKAGTFMEKPVHNNWLCELPRRPFMLGASLSGMTGMTIGTLLGLGFMSMQVPSLPLGGFVLYKGIYGGMLGTFASAAVLLRWQMTEKEV